MDKLKKYKIYFLTFFLALIALFIISISIKLFPFGNNTLGWGDSSSQIIPFTQEFINRISSGDNLVYSFSNGFGSSFYYNILYYLFSPFNILFLILKNHNLFKVFNLIVFSKSIFASLTMTFYLKNKFNSTKYYISLLSIL